jgi:hypothetical protein
MNNIFIIAGLVSFIFTIMKFLEMKFLEKENKKPLKYLIRDSLLVYFSVITGNFLLEQISPSLNTSNKHSTPPAFISEPTF